MGYLVWWGDKMMIIMMVITITDVRTNLYTWEYYDQTCMPTTAVVRVVINKYERH